MTEYVKLHMRSPQEAAEYYAGRRDGTIPPPEQTPDEDDLRKTALESGEPWNPPAPVVKRKPARINFLEK